MAGRWPAVGRPTAKLATIFLCKKTFLHKTAYTWVNNEDMNTASPTIEKESFFECNHIRKKILSFIFIPGFGLLFFETAGQRPAISWPSLGHQILRSKFQTFLKVFEKNDAKVILMSTNIIMGQLNIKDYEYDNGITIFWLCENLRTHFHLRLFDPWHV